jgi:uroporphyrinogen III methyltransferase/synthase
VSDAAEQPLRGLRILLTRRPEQSAALADRLTAAGAVVVQAPLIEVAPPEDTGPLDRALRALGEFDWLVLTSGNAARALRTRLEALALDPVLPAGLRVATVGPATSSAARALLGASRIDAEPATDFRAESLLAVLAAHDLAKRRVLIPLSDRARDVIRAGLEDRGARVEAVVAYRTVLPAEARDRLEECLRQGVDMIAFASPSAVEGFTAAMGGAGGVPAAVIGPVTAAAARQAGLDVRVVASPATTEGLLAALALYFARSGTP